VTVSMNKRYMGVLIVVFAALVVVYYSSVRPNVRSALNRNRIAVIQCAIGDSIVLGKKNDDELLLHIKKTWPKITVTSNAVLDYYRNPVRYVVTEEGSNSIFHWCL